MATLRTALALVVLAFGSAALAAAPAKKPLTFGIAQPYGAEHAAAAKKLIEPFLTSAMGSPVTVVMHPGYEELSDALAAGTIDIAWITPYAFVRAMQKTPYVQALSKAMRTGDGGLFYRSVFIVKKDSPAQKLADLKGKKIAWVNKLSTSGYLFPRELLRKRASIPTSSSAASRSPAITPPPARSCAKGRPTPPPPSPPERPS